jgi:hypothetical protein
MPKHADTPVSTPLHPARCPGHPPPGHHEAVISMATDHAQFLARMVRYRGCTATLFDDTPTTPGTNPSMIKRPKGDELM